MLSSCYGAKSTVHEHFQRWSRAGGMEEIFRMLLTEYGEKIGIDTQWQVMDGSLLQAPTHSQKSVAEGPGRNPADRGRSGSKLHLHVDGHGVPWESLLRGHRA